MSEEKENDDNILTYEYTRHYLLKNGEKKSYINKYKRQKKLGKRGRKKKTKTLCFEIVKKLDEDKLKKLLDYLENL